MKVTNYFNEKGPTIQKLIENLFLEINLEESDFFVWTFYKKNRFF